MLTCTLTGGLGLSGKAAAWLWKTGSPLSHVIRVVSFSSPCRAQAQLGELQALPASSVSLMAAHWVSLFPEAAKDLRDAWPQIHAALHETMVAAMHLHNHGPPAICCAQVKGQPKPCLGTQSSTEQQRLMQRLASTQVQDVVACCCIHTRLHISMHCVVGCDVLIDIKFSNCSCCRA